MKTRKLCAFLVLVFLVTFILPLSIQASIADEAVSYEWGHTYSGYHGKIYWFLLKQKSNVSFRLKCSGDYNNDLYILNNTGKTILGTNDFKQTYNEATDYTLFTGARVLSSGKYYVKIEAESLKAFYSFFATSEPAISLSRPSINSVTNSASTKMTVKVSSIKNRTGYQIQYATNSSFTGVKIVSCGGVTKIIGSLKKGKTYYVRVRAYAIYGSGNKVYSAWSPVKVVKIKK